MTKPKIHPHDALIHKLEECAEDLRKLYSKYNIDSDEFDDAYQAIDSAIGNVRQINL